MHRATLNPSVFFCYNCNLFSVHLLVPLIQNKDPVLFSGSLRNCLDPFGTFDDVDLLTALDAVGLKQSLAGFCSSSSSSSSSETGNSGSAGGALLTLPVNDSGSNW